MRSCYELVASDAMMRATAIDPAGKPPVSALCVAVLLTVFLLAVRAPASVATEGAIVMGPPASEPHKAGQGGVGSATFSEDKSWLHGEPLYSAHFSDSGRLRFFESSGSEDRLPDDAEQLLKVLETGRGPSQRAEAACALGRRGYAPVVPALVSIVERPLPAGEDKLKERTDIVFLQLIAINVLGEMKDERAVPALLRATDRTETQSGAIWVYSYKGGVMNPFDPAKWTFRYFPAAVPWGEQREEVGLDAIVALGEIGSPKAVPTLMSKLQDKNYSRRQAVAFALGMFGDDEAVPALQQIERQSKGDLRSSARDALLRIASRQESVKELIRDLESKDAQVVYYAMRRLDVLKPQEAVPALKGLVRDGRCCTDALGPGINISYLTGYVAQTTLWRIQTSSVRSQPSGPARGQN
jgi:hypothetical protein